MQSRTHVEYLTAPAGGICAVRNMSEYDHVFSGSYDDCVEWLRDYYGRHPEQLSSTNLPYEVVDFESGKLIKWSLH